MRRGRLPSFGIFMGCMPVVSRCLCAPRKGGCIISLCYHKEADAMET